VRRHPARRAVLVAACTAGVLLASSSGVGAARASAPVPPNRWWGTICRDFNAYTKDTGKYERVLVTTLQNPRSLSDVRTKLIQYLNSNIIRANELLATLRRAGVPAVPGGAQYAAAIQSGFVQLRDGFEGLLPDARATPTSSATAVQDAVNGMRTKLMVLASQSSSTIDAANQAAAPQLLAARQAQKACRAAG